MLLSTGELANIYLDSRVKPQSLAGESFWEGRRSACCMYDKYEMSFTVPKRWELHCPKGLKRYPHRTTQGETWDKIPPASLLGDIWGPLPSCVWLQILLDILQWIVQKCVVNQINPTGFLAWLGEINIYEGKKIIAGLKKPETASCICWRLMALCFQIAKPALGLTTKSNKNLIFEGRKTEIVFF